MRTPRGDAVLRAVAGLIGAAGVMLAAAAAHRGGGDLTSTAATFAILHAGAIIALTGSAHAGSGIGWTVAAVAMAVGTILFSGDLALTGLAGVRPWPQAAPVGGTVLILAWFLVAGCGLIRAVRG